MRDNGQCTVKTANINRIRPTAVDGTYITWVSGISKKQQE